MATPAETIQRSRDELNELLDFVHPLMAESFYIAAVPHWYTESLFTVMRATDDGRSSGIVERLASYFFIYSPGQHEVIDEEPWVFSDIERDLLNEYAIERVPALYRAAHATAYDWWHAHADLDARVRDHELIYHKLIADPDKGQTLLIEKFVIYADERHLAAIEQLIDIIDEASRWLTLLGDERAPRLATFLTYMQARLAQLRGQWDESARLIASVNLDVVPELRPYVLRTDAATKAGQGRFAAAIDNYEQSLSAFDDGVMVAGSGTLADARASTVLGMGRAYIGLAEQAQLLDIRPRNLSLVTTIARGVFHLVLSLPLLLYLALRFGKDVLWPRFWLTLEELDWAVARLFAKGASLFSEADKSVSDDVREQEEAQLHLRMGNPLTAQRLLAKQLESAEPGRYQTAVMQLGLAEVLLMQGDSAESHENAKRALDPLLHFDDRTLAARAQMLLGDTADDVKTARDHYRESLSLYRSVSDQVAVTRVIGRIEATDEKLATDFTDEPREYRVRFRHPNIINLQRVMIMAVFALGFLVATKILHVEHSLTLRPQISYQPTVLLDESQTIDIGLNVTETSPQIKLQDLDEATLVNISLPWAIATSLLYLFVTAVVGMRILDATTPESVQDAGRRGVLRIDKDSISVGDDEPLLLSDVTEIRIADVFYYDEVVPEESSMLLISAENRSLLISGFTDQYLGIQQRLRDNLPNVPVIDRSYRMFKSVLGFFYVVALVMLILLLFAGTFTGELLSNQIPGTPFTVANLLPFFHVIFLLPPLWWFAIRMPRKRLTVNPGDNMPWWMLLVGIVIGVLIIGVQFRPWLTPPDIYPAFVAIVLIGQGGWLLWQDRKSEADTEWVGRNHRWLWPAMSVVGALLCIVMAFHIVRELAVYRYAVYGNAHRDAAVVLDGSERQDEFRTALADYEKALAWGNWRILGLPSRSTSEIYTNRAAMELSIGADISADSDEASDVDDVGARSIENVLNDLNNAIARDRGAAINYLWRGYLRQSLDRTDQARGDFERAIEILGLGRLSAEDKVAAYTALGWNLYGANQNEEAVAAFEDGVQLANRRDDVVSAEVRAGALSGAGYANYRITNWDAARNAWEAERAATGDTHRVIQNLGTLEWRLGTLDEATETVGNNRCVKEELPLEERLREQAHLEASLRLYSEAAGFPEIDDQTRASIFGTMGQVRFLLGSCPDYNRREALEQAADDYARAIELVPDYAFYYFRRASLEYAAWFSSELRGAISRERLVNIGLPAIEMAVALEPDETGFQDYRELVADEAIDGTLNRGDGRLANGDYQSGLEYYLLVANGVPENASAAFKSGLAYVWLEDGNAAAEWYVAGAERSSQMSAADARNEIANAIEDLEAAPLPESAWAARKAIIEWLRAYR